MKNYRWILFQLSLLLMLTGCATSNIWSEDTYDEYKPSATATGLEIYGESPTLLNKYDHPEVRISYTAAQKTIPNIPIPPSSEGCIILKRFDDSSRFLVGLESLLNAIPRSKIDSVKAVISHRPPAAGHGPSERYSVRLGLALRPGPNGLFDETGRPKVDSSWVRFLGQSPPQGAARIAQDYPRNPQYTPLDSYIIPNNSEMGTLYFLVGGPSGGGPSGSARLEFANKCTGDRDFIPLLRDMKAPFSLQFVEGKKAMKYSLANRIIMTPFTVAFDILMLPIQTVLMPIFWGIKF